MENLKLIIDREDKRGISKFSTPCISKVSPVCEVICETSVPWGKRTCFNCRAFKMKLRDKERHGIIKKLAEKPSSL